MAGRNVQYEAHLQDEPSTVWNQIAVKAGYPDARTFWPQSYEQNRRGVLWAIVNIFERCTAAIVLVCLSPIFLAAAVAITVLSRRVPLVAHRRVGQHGLELWVLKLRTMWGIETTYGTVRNGVERLVDSSVAERKASTDTRIRSRFARVCRKYSIDEIPQLWQVLRGEMALVGPRPLTAEEIRNHYGNCSAILYRMKPGLTGLWQIRGRSRLDYRHRRKLDTFMVQHWSLRLYLFIVRVTIPRVLLGKDAW